MICSGVEARDVSRDRVDAKVQLFIWWKERAQTGGTDAVNSALERLLGL
ncbi:MAG: hypothetical protein AAGA48_30005 [Myxococcota bacterium]